MAILIGMPLLVSFMVFVIGAPLIYYLKRDRAFEPMKDQPEDIRRKAWYER